MARISPWKGYPKTQVATDENGKRCFIVRPRALTPQRAKAAQAASTAIAAGLTIYGLIFVSHGSNPPLWAWLAAACLPWIFLSVIHDTVADLIAKETKIVLTETTFEVHGLFGRRVYDRTQKHSVSLVEHDLMKAEIRDHEVTLRRAAQKGKVIKKTPYFADSAHISFNYLGQRNDVLTVYPLSLARIVAGRLAACDEALTDQIGSGDGFESGPRQQWADQPGDIPEDE